MPATSSSMLPRTSRRRRDREPGERVEQRDHDRHVGAADRQHEQHADRRPSRSAARRRAPVAGCRRRHAAARPARRRPTPPNTTGRPGKTTGRVVMSSCSLANVTDEPVNETAPTSSVNAIAASAHPPTSSRAATCRELEQRDQRRRAAADAVEERDQLRHLRSSGRGARRRRRPTVPTAMAARIGGEVVELDVERTRTTAISAPAAPIRLPRRAVLGEDSPLSARMKQTAATR